MTLSRYLAEGEMAHDVTGIAAKAMQGVYTLVVRSLKGPFPGQEVGLLCNSS